MKIHRILPILLLPFSCFAEVSDSTILNSRVWALLDEQGVVYYPVDVDQDGQSDVYLYADFDALVGSSGAADSYHIRLTTRK